MFKNKIRNKQYMEIGIIVVFVGIILFVSAGIVRNSGNILHFSGGAVATFLNIISPIICAFALSYILYFPMIGLEKSILKHIFHGKYSKKQHNGVRLLCVITIFMIMIIIVGSIINYFIPIIVSNVESLLKGLPQIEQKINIWLNQFNDLMVSLNVDLSSRTEIIEQVGNTLRLLGESLLNVLPRLISNMSSLVMDTVVTIILTFYFLKDKEKMCGAVNKFGTLILSPRMHHYVNIFLSDVNQVVGGFLIGTIISCVVVGIVSTALMILIGHPFAIVIGVVAGITNVIPYVGPVIGALLAFILGLFKNINFAILAVVVLVLYQQVDGNIVQPKIVGDKVGVTPVWILISVLIGGSYFGGVGMILAIPVAALINVYINRLYEMKMDKIQSKGELNSLLKKDTI